MYGGVFLILLAYLVGSIPFGVLIVHLLGSGNLRKMGSGNIGATNVLRTQGKLLGVLVFLLDSAKGAVICAIAAQSPQFTTYLPWVGVSVVLGHTHSVFLRFNGGKGVATALGVFLVLTPSIGFLAFLLWIVMFSFSRISSLSSLVSISSAPWILLGQQGSVNPSSLFWAYLCISATVALRHRTNIVRLIQGKESRFNRG